MKFVPNSLVVNTGEQHEISKTIDDFFVGTKEFIQETYKVQELDFQIKSGELAYHSSQITSDRITYLSYKDIIFASVIETRSEFNHIRYTFFKNMNDLKNLTPRFK